ncbi:FtsX-like permease family protein [Lysinibacillus sp. MHQ-1]|nr:FtsX-like permease family protein [Lysinibacillus sp. MHQ-1]
MFSIIIFFFIFCNRLSSQLKRPRSRLNTWHFINACQYACLFIFIYLYYLFNHGIFYAKKTKTLGIFMITGASMKQVRKLIFRENLFIGIMAIIAAIVLGLVMTPPVLNGG